MRNTPERHERLWTLAAGLFGLMLLAGAMTMLTAWLLGADWSLP